MSEKMKTTPESGSSRRGFIKQTAAVAAVTAAANPFVTPVYGQSQAPSTGRVIGANDRIVVGFVGVGGQGMAHVRSVKRNAGANNVEIVAACDVSKTRTSEAVQYIGGDCKGYGDHRKVVERKDIDVVICSTVDHWHTDVTCDALESGKHVYCEKPMTRYLGEAFRIYDVAKKTGKLVQVGAQRTSSGAYHKAAAMNKEGLCGALVLATGSYMRNNPKGEWNYQIPGYATAEDIDWGRWMGRVHKKTGFNADHFSRWRKYYPYCAGVLGDLLPHRLHPLMLATGNPQFPTRVVSLGNSAYRTDGNTPDTYPRDVDENVQILAEFPGGFNIFLTSGTVNEQGVVEMIRGHQGNMYLGNGKVEFKPERPFADEIDPETHNGLEPGEDISSHEKNLFDAIRSGNQPSANIDLAVKVQTVVSLAEISDRLNVMCLFDEKTRKIKTGNGIEVEAITYGSVELS